MEIRINYEKKSIIVLENNRIIAYNEIENVLDECGYTFNDFLNWNKEEKIRFADLFLMDEEALRSRNGQKQYVDFLKTLNIDDFQIL